MPEQTKNIQSEEGPDGSIFLYNPLNEREFQHRYFAMLLGRGDYKDMDPQDAEDHLRELKLRRALTERAVKAY